METADGPRMRTDEPLLRRVVIAGVGASLLFAGVALLVRPGGYPERRFAATSDRQWLVDRATGTVALADPVSGRVVVRIDSQRAGNILDTTQGDAGSFLIDRTRGQVIAIDEQNVRLGSPRPVPALTSGDSDWTYAVGGTALVAAPTKGGTGVLVPLQDEPRSFALAPSGIPLVTTPSGAIWQLSDEGGRIDVITPQKVRFTLDTGSPDALLTALGEQAIVLERRSGELDWLGTANVTPLGGELDAQRAVVQLPSGPAPCVWIGSGDELACVDRTGVSVRRRITGGFQFAPSDRLAVAEGVAVVVGAAGNITRIDTTNGEATRVPVPSPGEHTVIRSVGRNVWVDDPAAPMAMSIGASGVHTFDKLDDRAPLFGAGGQPLELGGPDDSGVVAAPAVDGSADLAADAVVVAPDDDGIAEPPIAVDDRVSGSSRQALLVNVLANDWDPDGDPILVSATGAAAHGTVDIVGPNLVRFNPAAGFSGIDLFTYTIADATDKEATARVTVEVLSPDSPNSAPVAVPDARETAAGRPVHLDVLSNDSDPDGDPLIVAEVVPPPTNEATISRATGDDGQPILRLTPGPDSPGRTISFSYRAADPGGATSEPVTVRIAVAPTSTSNRPPVATPDAARIRPGRTVSIPVLANDFDPDGDPLIIASTDPGRGVTAIAGRSIEFTPPADATGRIGFAYTVSDPDGRTARATVLVQIIGPDVPNVGPVARPDSRTTTGGPVFLNPVANDFDPDGDRLTAKIGSAVGVTVDLTGDQPKFTPIAGFIGDAVVTYELSDGHGHTTKGVIRIEVDPTAEAPPLSADDDSATFAPGEEGPIDVLRNDTVPAGDTVRVRAICPTGVTCAVVPATNAILFRAPNRPGGVLTFAYELTSSSGESARASVVVTISTPTAPATSVVPAPPPEATGDSPPITEPPPAVLAGPTAVDDRRTRIAGEVVTIDVLDNDLGPNGGLRVSSAGVVGGTVDAVATYAGRSVTVTPSNTLTGDVVVRYRVTDAANLGATANLVVTYVAAPNRPPIAADDTATTQAGQPVDIPVLANDSDPEGGPLSAQLVKSPPSTAGRAEPGAGGSIRFVPDPAFSGTTTFTYVAFDGGGLASAPATVTVTVTAEQRCTAATPIALGRSGLFTPYLTPLTIDVLDSSQRSYEVLLGAVSGGIAQTGAENGLVVFTPSAGNSGSGSFVVTVRNPCGDTRSATFTIDVNRPPSVKGITREIVRDTTLTVDVAEQANDDEAIHYAAAKPSVGTVAIDGDGQRLVFTPPPGFVGSATIRVTVVDAGSLTATATIKVAVTPPPNAAPIAVRDEYRSLPGQRLALDLLDNDQDPDGRHEDLRIELVDGDVHVDDGEYVVELADDGRSVVIDLPADAHGRGSFRYRAIDGEGAASDVVKAVIVVNRPPNSIHSSITLACGGSTVLRPLTWKVMDDDGDPVEIVSVDGSDPGYDVGLADTATITLTTSGDCPDEGAITFVVEDSWGARTTSTITVLSTN